MPSEWARRKARERFRETGMDLPERGAEVAARDVGRFIDRIRNEVLEEAAGVCDRRKKAWADMVSRHPMDIRHYDACADEAEGCAKQLRALKTPDSGGGG